MKKIVDARGLSCPQPVVLTNKAMAEADDVTVIVNDAVAMENVTRLARTKGFSVERSEKPDGIFLALSRDPSAAASTEEPVVACASSPSSAGPLVLFVPSDGFGRGSDELGNRLMGAFFHSLLEIEAKPKLIIFMNSGVKLAVEGARALDDIRALEKQGIDILVCGTCLGYFNLTEKLAVGRVSNMYDIATALMEAGKIVEL